MTAGPLARFKVLDLTRVRAGPFPNREAAEKALDKLKKIGVGGVVAGLIGVGGGVVFVPAMTIILSKGQVEA